MDSEAASAEVSSSVLTLNSVGNLVNLVPDIAARGEKTSRNQPKNQRSHSPEDE